MPADVIKEYGSVIVTGIIVGSGTLFPRLWERAKGKRRATSFERSFERVEKLIGTNHRELSEQLAQMDYFITEVEKTATEALHHAIGADGQNGNRGNINKLDKRITDLETWQESETIRQREALERKLAEARAQRRGMSPSDIGKLRPEGA